MRIAVTGGIAEGKSTVLGYLREAGFATASSDQIARDVFSEPSIQGALADLLGVEAPPEREAVRAALAQPGIRRAINSLTHPLIAQRLRETRATYVEVPLLIEACLQAEFDRVWVVTCGRVEQLRRLASRLHSHAAAEALICTQLASSAKIAFADRIIRTNLDEPSVRRCVSLAAAEEMA